MAVRNDLACRGSRCQISKGQDGPGCACYDGLRAAEIARNARPKEDAMPTPDHHGAPLPPCCLYVPHGAEQKMVGKLIEHIAHGPVFLHAHTTSQRHDKTGCPAPLDEALLVALKGWGVRYCYCYERDRLILRRIVVETALDAPAALYDGRLRRFPPEDAWTRLTGVTERRRGRAVELLNAAEVPILVDPWATREVRLGVEVAL